MNFLDQQSSAAAAGLHQRPTSSSLPPPPPQTDPFYATNHFANVPLGLASASSSSNSASLPQHAESIETKERARRFRSTCIGRIYLLSVRCVTWFFNTTALLLECCCPRAFGFKSVEEGRLASTRARNLAGKWNAEFIRNWCSVMTYLVLVSAGVTLFIVFVILAPHDASSYARAKRSETLMRHCHSHDDRVKVLQETALRVPLDSLTSGTLPCGTRVERIKEKLISLHERHNDREHMCLTAKHLNHSYAIVSMQQSDGVVAFLFNPENYAPLGTARVEIVETSDFFPLHPPVQVWRPLRAWVSYTDSSVRKQRVILENATLHCVLHAWEILSGEHYLRFSGAALEQGNNN